MPLRQARLPFGPQHREEVRIPALALHITCIQAKRALERQAILPSELDAGGVARVTPPDQPLPAPGIKPPAKQRRKHPRAEPAAGVAGADPHADLGVGFAERPPAKVESSAPRQYAAGP